jgi:hypothetical protein
MRHGPWTRPCVSRRMWPTLTALDWVLVSAFTSVRKQRGELKLLNLTNKVEDVMQITKLYFVFDVMEDEAVGVESFGNLQADHREVVTAQVRRNGSGTEITEGNLA